MLTPTPVFIIFFLFFFFTEEGIYCGCLYETSVFGKQSEAARRL